MKGARTLAVAFPWSLLGPRAFVFRTFAEHHFHGADLACGVGSLVPAPRAGIVVYTGWVGPRDVSSGNSLGYSVVLHDPRLSEWWLLGHGNGSYLARAGAIVPQGAPLMRSGNSGHSGGPHVHTERWALVPWPRKGKFLDPLEGTPYASAPRPSAVPRVGAGAAGYKPASRGAPPVHRGWYVL